MENLLQNFNFSWFFTLQKQYVKSGNVLQSFWAGKYELAALLTNVLDFLKNRVAMDYSQLFILSFLLNLI